MGLMADVEPQEGDRIPLMIWGALSVFQGPSVGWEGGASETDLPGRTGRRTQAQRRAEAAVSGERPAGACLGGLLGSQEIGVHSSLLPPWGTRLKLTDCLSPLNKTLRNPW